MNFLETESVTAVMVLDQLWRMAGRHWLEGTGHTLWHQRRGSSMNLYWSRHPPRYVILTGFGKLEAWGASFVRGGPRDSFQRYLLSGKFVTVSIAAWVFIWSPSPVASSLSLSWAPEATGLHWTNFDDFLFSALMKLLPPPVPTPVVSFPSSQLCCYEARSGAGGTQWV